nr:retrotransposon protein, putative, Ty3-gypsy subclass [Tanacetum cinerariifolium]
MQILMVGMEMVGTMDALTRHSWLVILETMIGKVVKARGRKASMAMTWVQFKALLMEEFCPSNEMEKLEIPHLVTPESKRIGRSMRKERKWKKQVNKGVYEKLSKNKAEIVCHEKVVRIPLEGDEVYIDDILIYSKNKEDYEVHLKLVLELLKKERLYAKFSKCEFWLLEVHFLSHVVNRNGIHVEPSKIEAVNNWKAPIKNKKYEWGVRQEEAFQTLKDNLCNAPILTLPGGIKDFVVYCDASNQGLGCVLMQSGKVPLVGGGRTIITDEAHKTRYFVHPGADKMYYDLRDMYWWPGVKRDIATYHSSNRCAPFEALYGRKCRSPVLWAKIRESRLIGPELVQETIDNVVLKKEKLKAARDRQKSYADNRRKPLEFEVED